MQPTFEQCSKINKTFDTPKQLAKIIMCSLIILLKTGGTEQ